MTGVTEAKAATAGTRTSERKRRDTVAAPAKPETPGQLFSLPFVGATRVEDVAFYGVLGVLTVVEVVSWPTAALFGTAHALHQRARNLLAHGHERGALIEGSLEATEGMGVL